MEASGTRARGTGKEIPALLACLIWAGGFELVPAIHLIQHAELAPHHHGEHSHGGEPHTHEHEHEAPDEHGDGSLAHRGLAALSPPPALPPIERPFLGIARFDRAAPEQAPWREPSRPRARAPPIATR